MPTLKVTHPWLIVHAPNGREDEPLHTIIGGPAKASHKHFGVVMADAIREAAKIYKVKPEDIVTWIERELKHPGQVGSQFK